MRLNRQGLLPAAKIAQQVSRPTARLQFFQCYKIARIRLLHTAMHTLNALYAHIVYAYTRWLI